MRFDRALLVTLLLAAGVAAAQTPVGIGSRQVYLYRAIDGWDLELSMAVAMIADPFQAVRAHAVQV